MTAVVPPEYDFFCKGVVYAMGMCYNYLIFMWQIMVKLYSGKGVRRYAYQEIGIPLFLPDSFARHNHALSGICPGAGPESRARRLV